AAGVLGRRAAAAGPGDAAGAARGRPALRDPPLARLDLRAGTGTLDAIDDDAVAGLDAVDDRQAAGLIRAHVDVALLARVVGADHEDVAAALVGGDRPLRNEQPLARPADRDADAHEQAGRQQVVGVGQFAAQEDGAGAGVDAVVAELDDA